MPVGRQQGTVGKLRMQTLQALERRLGPDFEPLSIIAEESLALLQQARDDNDPQLRIAGINGLEKVCKYIMPQVKAMEIDVTNSDGSLQAPPREVRMIPVPMSQGKITRADAAQLLEHNDGQD